MNRGDFKEIDLYIPLKKFFETLGYVVHGEVKNCDIVASKEDELIVLELKKAFNLKLIYQGLDRLKISNNVYLCIPRPQNAKTTSYKSMVKLVKKLELGLITVALDSPTKAINVIVFPGLTAKNLNSKLKSHILREISGRALDVNTGGSTRTKINTAYREKCLQIACVLNRVDMLTPKKLVADYGCPSNTGAILASNFYGWFIKIEKGVYALNHKGMEELANSSFSELTTYYNAKLDETGRF